MGKPAALLIAGMATLGLTDNLVRLIADAAGLWQFHLLRTAMALPLSLPVVNLLVPILGVAVFTHQFHRMAGDSVIAVPRRTAL